MELLKNECSWLFKVQDLFVLCIVLQGLGVELGLKKLVQFCYPEFNGEQQGRTASFEGAGLGYHILGLLLTQILFSCRAYFVSFLFFCLIQSENYEKYTCVV